MRYDFLLSRGEPAGDEGFSSGWGMVQRMREEMVGRWHAVRRGESLQQLRPVDGHPRALLFREDGTAEVLAGSIPSSRQERDWEWYIVGEKLVLTAPVDAVPAQGAADLPVDDVCEQIVAVGEDRLILDARPYGGDCVTVFERV